jgi:rhamnosyltransferase
VTVAVPVRNGGKLLEQVLTAVSRQRLARPVELLVADSGSTDGSRELALRHGAQLIDVAQGEFSHGGTRNLLAERASGSHIAYLTQDAVPASENWLAELLGGFQLAGDIALSYGPYRARPAASLSVRRELDAWFGSLPAVVERGAEAAADPRRAFFTDANGCLARAAWCEVPFRAVPYAEDQVLARDMLLAGYAKVYRPGAPVVHSHQYGAGKRFRRSFDEWRAMREIGMVTATPSFRSAVLGLQRAVRDDFALARSEARTRGGRGATNVAASLRHHLPAAAGAMLGARAEHLPSPVRRVSSLEGRPGFDRIEERP